MPILKPNATDIAELHNALKGQPPSIPSRFFYDERGGELFEQITRLPEYYPTQTEISILEARAEEVIAAVRPEDLTEIGAATDLKVRLLLDAMQRAGHLRRCRIFDINEAGLAQAARVLRHDYPDLDVAAIRGDFTRDLQRLGTGGRRLLAFLGGTLGNMTPVQANRFFRQVGAIMSATDGFLVGLDLVKDVEVIEAAYNDDQGVTAEFNRNILRVLNERFLANFEVECFDHRAFYDTGNTRVEMHLRANAPSDVFIEALDLHLHFEAGDEIRTEISCKYSRESLRVLLVGTGLMIADWFTDPRRYFALALLRRQRGV